MKLILRAAQAFGVLLIALLLLELRLRTVARPTPLPAVFVPENKLRILALGDSITHGGLKDASYPVPLTKLLEKEFGAGSVEIYNLGVPGAETADLYRNLDGWLATYRPHVVITMTGAGDRDQAASRFASFTRRLRLMKLLDVAWASSRSWVLGRWQKWFGAPEEAVDPLVATARAYLASGRDDVLFIRELIDPLVASSRPKTAEELSRRMLARHPRHLNARIGLGRALMKMDQLEEAEEHFRAAIALHEATPEGRNSVSLGHRYLAILLQQAERDKDLETLMKKLIADHPAHEMAYEFLAVLYRKQNRGMELQRLIESGLEKVERPERLRMMLARYFQESGHPEEAKRQEEAARAVLKKSFEGEGTGPVYRALRDRVISSGAALLAMQYPVLDVGILRDVLGAESRSFRYVDNGSFREALREKQFAYYFYDDFGGSYGHLTRPGAELVARNVAAVLVPLLRERGARGR